MATDPPEDPNDPDFGDEPELDWEDMEPEKNNE